MKKLITFLVVLVLILGIVEGMLRLLGKTPNRYAPESVHIQSEPTSLFQVDTILGYNYAIGQKKITINQSLEYDIQVNKNGLRNNPFYEKSAFGIYLFGSSFFAGMGVDDDEVVSAQLQDIMKKNGYTVSVENYSIPGHGMPSEYQRLNELSAKEDTIWAVFEVASFHLERNAGAYLFVKNFSKFNDVPMQYLIAELRDKHLVLRMLDVSSKISFVETKSALVYELKKIVKQQEFSREYLLQLELALIDSVYALCQEKNINPLFVNISHDDVSREITNHLLGNDYPFIISEVDYNLDEFNLNPYDQHPNAYAHERYALEIFDFIKNDQFR